MGNHVMFVKKSGQMPKKTKLPKEWSPNAKKTFERLFIEISHNQDAMTHPKAVKQPKDHWVTIAHNAAWLAACGYDGR